jgi:hypothetical protein
MAMRNAEIWRATDQVVGRRPKKAQKTQISADSARWRTGPGRSPGER